MYQKPRPSAVYTSPEAQLLVFIDKVKWRMVRGLWNRGQISSHFYPDIKKNGLSGGLCSFALVVEVPDVLVL